MNYNTDFFRKLEMKMEDAFGDADAPFGPFFEDDADYDKYMEDFESYDDWLVAQKLEDSIETRITYFQFILDLLQEKNAPEYFGYFLKHKHFTVLQQVARYVADEIGLQTIDPYGIHNDFIISARADYEPELRDLRWDAFDDMLEKYFNNRLDLYDIFIGGLYSIYDYLVSQAEM